MSESEPAAASSVETVVGTKTPVNWVLIGVIGAIVVACLVTLLVVFLPRTTPTTPTTPTPSAATQSYTNGPGTAPMPAACAADLQEVAGACVRNVCTDPRTFTYTQVECAFQNKCGTVTIPGKCTSQVVQTSADRPRACASNQTEFDGLCYTNCRAGYVSAGGALCQPSILSA